jgi:hypothetical protein
MPVVTRLEKAGPVLHAPIQAFSPRPLTVALPGRDGHFFYDKLPPVAFTRS